MEGGQMARRYDEISVHVEDVIRMTGTVLGKRTQGSRGEYSISAEEVDLDGIPLYMIKSDTDYIECHYTGC